MSTTNYQIRLRERPTGIPEPETFSAHESPVEPPQDGDVLLETLYLSVDPAMRVWIGDNPGYVEPVAVGDVMRAGGIGRVVESRYDGLQPGDVVQGRLGWQSHPTLSGQELQKLDLELGSVLDWMGPLGGTGLTAYFGFFEVGQAKPDDVVLVSAAAGGVGQMVCQIAKLYGCRTIGIAGGPEKCAFISHEFGLDGVIDYKATADPDAAIKTHSATGIDLYFDNVGGPMLDAAIQNLRTGGRVTLCGRISQTAASELYGVRNIGLLIGKRACLAGFIVSDFSDQFTEARQWLSQHVKAGRIRQKLHLLDGLSQAPEGLQMLFRSANFGKLIIKVKDA
ncbi:MAG: NADP-dependent oxidoreductase [Candidatus Tectomicrobia bacterium]|nr:NADP-dependent oxidoreductase [Candidatus Tectomicrobia bacterium]